MDGQHHRQNRSAARLRAELASPTGASAGQPNSTIRIERIGVVVPANNEADALPACLGGLHAAARYVTVPVTVIVVLDSCTDASSEVVDNAAHRLSSLSVASLTVDARNVGFARRIGMTELLRRYPSQGTWLATTDADSVVPEHWFIGQFSHAAAGANVVAGTVSVADWQDHSHAVQDRAIKDYGATPHRHIHGANLSFSAIAYQAAGGFAPLTTNEDVALVQAFRGNDEPIAWAMDLAVSTSARRQARAPRGFAGYLSSLAESLDPIKESR